MILKKGRLLFSAAFVVFSALLLTGCFSSDYEPATINFISPENGQVFPDGTTSVTIEGRVNKGESSVVALQVTNGAGSTTVTDFNKLTGKFTYEFTVDPIPEGKHFKASTCTFRVMDSKLKTNNERITVVVAESYISHVIELNDENEFEKNIYLVAKNDEGVYERNEIDSGVILDNATASISLTEDLINEAVPYMAGVVEMMLPDIVNDVMNEIGLYGLQITDMAFGDINMGIDFIEGQDISSSISVTPSSDVPGNNAIYVRATVLGIPFEISADSMKIANAYGNLGVNEDHMLTFSLDLKNHDFDLSIKDPDIVLGGFIDIVPNILVDIVVGILKGALQKIEIDELPILDVSALSLNFPRISAAIDFPETPGPIFITSDDAMRTTIGVYLAYTEWLNMLNESENTFVFTPGDVLPTIMADPTTGQSDMIAAVSDDLFNQATAFMVQSGFLENLLDLIDIDAIVRAIAPTLYEYSPDLDISIMIPTPPLADFSTDESAGEGTFGKFTINNMIIQIANLKLTRYSQPQTFRFSLDANNLGLRLNFNDDMTQIIAGADFKIEDLNFMVLYMSVPGTEVINSVTELALGIGAKIIDTIIPLTFSVDIPDQEFPLPAIQFTENRLEDNFLIISMGAEFPDM